MSFVDIDTVVACGGSHILDGDSEEMVIAKTLRNNRIQRDLQTKADLYQARVASNRAHIHQYRLQEARRKAAAEYKAAEQSKQLPRVLAWLLVLMGCYYIPALFCHAFDPTPVVMTAQVWIFWIWAAIWCMWGFIQIMWMSDSSFAVLILLWVIPFYACGPILYLWESYTASQSIKRVEGLA
jgi:hypothetical protein